MPTWTPIPIPNEPPPPPLVDLITTFIGKWAPDPELTAPLPPWMQPPNLELVALEITQAVQCMQNLKCADNSVALYDGKLTMVRAYVRLTAGPTNWLSNIGGALCPGLTGSAGCVNPIRPLYKITVFHKSTYPNPVTQFRGQLLYTLDFILPAEMVSGTGGQDLTAYINYNFEDEPKEAFYKDNYRSLSYEIQESEPFYVGFHLVQNKGTMAQFSSIWTTYDYLHSAFPTNAVYMSLDWPLFGKDYSWKDPDGGCGKGWGQLLVDLWWFDRDTGPYPYGLVPAATVTKYGGCGSIGGTGAAGLDNASSGRIAAQELGHNLNRAHTPGCGAGGPDNSYPGVNGLLDETGVDVLNRLVFQPYWAYDYMGYCGGSSNSWTSVYTYEAIAGMLPAGAFQPPGARAALVRAADAEVLLASGEVAPDAAVIEHGFYRLAGGPSMALTADEGPYIVELLDAQGVVLASRRFRPMNMSNDEPGESGPFTLVVPWIEGTTSAVVLFQDTEIGRLEPGRRAPEVEFTSPADGQAWGASGSQTLSWTASDRDRDPLQYLLQYSRDGGATWEVLAPNLTDTSLELDTAWLPGSADGRFRLIATDGINSTQVDSGDVEVEGKPPEVHISSPTADDELIADSPVVLQGAATDLEDGFLGDSALTWSSEPEGPLGDGRTAVIAGLSEGPHRVTLTAIDSDGNSASTSVDVVVGPLPAGAAPKPAPSLWLCLIPAIAIVTVVAVAAYAFGRRSRRQTTGKP